MSTAGGNSVATATVIAKIADQTWRSDQTPAAGLSNPVRNRDAIWKYTPLTAGQLRFTNVESDASDTLLWLFSGPPDATTYGQLTQIQQSDDNAANNHETISWTVAAGTTYYLVSSAYNSGATLNYHILTVEQGPASAAVKGGQTIAEITVAGSLNYAPALHAGAELAIDITAQATLHYTEPVASPWTVSLSSPDADATIVSSTPRFMVGVDLDTDDDVDYVVEVQYDDNASFTSPTTVDGEANTGDGGALLSPDHPLVGTVYWRARVLVAAEPVSGWTAARKFTISAVVAATTIPVTWTVDASKKPPIHLWHFYPAGPSVGDAVTIFGQGFPASNVGYILYGGQEITAQSWTKVPAETGGVIEGGNVDPEHWEIVFTAPNLYPGTGAVLSVSDEQRLST